jgi:oxygen-independent coproporphyrinogen-3 oxidase
MFRAGGQLARHAFGPSTLSPTISVYALALDDPDAEGLTGELGDHLPLRAGARRWRERARSEQSDERAEDMEAMTDELCAAAGLQRYEIANLARPGHECRHNLAYWQRAAYEAVGPGAHAFDGVARRRWNAAALPAYLDALLPEHGPATLPPGGSESLSGATACAEAAILGLRLSSGLDASAASWPADGLALSGTADRYGDGASA